MPLFGPPKIDKLIAKGDVAGLVRALAYTKDRQIPTDAAAALTAFGAAAVEPLASVARDPRSPGRWYASEALSRVADPRAADALLAALGDESDVVRKAAVAALGGMRDVRAVDPLLGILADPRDDVRGAAVAALGEIGDRRAVEPLVGELTGEWSGLAVDALGQIGDVRAVEALCQVMFDASWRPRWRAADVLGDLGDVRAVESLIRALLDEELAAKDAHDSLAFARALGGLDPSRSSSLQAASDDQTAFVRTHAAMALGRLGDPRAVEPLRAALRELDQRGGGSAFREAARAALRSLGASETESSGGSDLSMGGRAEATGLTRQPKSLTINLGDVEESTLQAIIEVDQSMVIAQEARSDLVTPALAHQALSAKAYEHRADAFAQNREFSSAADEYREAIRTAPYEDEVLWMSLGGVLSELRAYPDALEALQTAYAINPTNDDVIRNLSVAQANSRSAATS
ncbi:HEAT repeat protein [Humibacillus xanthopallidus]|uniref:HEAT repeat protein n=1 Tax=Humibacillus xanthopallidus TaxID=412689 RepID=A0A543PN82_9MICO|nr:HEAT repeat domain-containing protein [Humibacillus xanthopallidus]TQN45534.1 HEAT repeat protein [Humibacillus xanthopallidus]